MPDAPYVIDGEWLDPEWADAAAKVQKTDLERAVVAFAPRSHPWGPLAYRADSGDGRTMIFPTEDAFFAWKASQSKQTVESIPDHDVVHTTAE